MSTKSGLVVREDKKLITKIKRKDVQIPLYITLFFTNCIEEICTTKMICVLTGK